MKKLPRMGELREPSRRADGPVYGTCGRATVRRVVPAFGRSGDTYEWLRSLDRVQDVVFDAIFNGEQPDTVASNISAIRRTAWVVRERFSRMTGAF